MEQSKAWWIIIIVAMVLGFLSLGFISGILIFLSIDAGYMHWLEGVIIGTSLFSMVGMVATVIIAVNKLYDL